MRHYFQSKPHRDHVKSKTCTWRILGWTDCDGPVDPHHEPELGNSDSDDLDCIPMCRFHHNKRKSDPKLFLSVITEQIAEREKRNMVRSFYRENGFQTDKPVTRVPQPKKQEAPKTSRFQAPIDQSKKRGKGSATRPLNVPRYT